MATSAVGRAVRMTGLKKPRPLKRVTVDDTDMPKSTTTELESKMKNFNLVQSRAEEFIKSESCVDEPDSCVKTSHNFSSHCAEPQNINFQPLNRVCDTNNNICHRSNNTQQKPRPHGFPHPQTEVTMSNRISDRDRSPKGTRNTSFTAIISLTKDGVDERLVLASTCMKSILKAASLLACHMNGELVYIDSSDGDSPGMKVQKDKQTSPQPQSPPSEFRNPPSRRALQAHMPDLPDLVQPGVGHAWFADYGRCESSNIYQSQQDWRFLHQSERRCEVPYRVMHAKERGVRPSVQYTVKTLLKLATQPHAKLPPRNWSLIKEAFPELVAHEDHYFEPFDLKACSPHALGRPRAVDFEIRCHMDGLEFQ